MNKLSRLIQAVAQTKASWDSVFLKNIGMDFDQGEVMKQPYSKSDLVYVCISTTNRAVSQVPLQVMQGEGEDAIYAGDDNPWQQLFFKPNIYLDKYSFTEAIIGYLLLEGDVFIVPLPLGLPPGVPPDSLWVVRKTHIEPKRNSIGQLESWIYNPRGAGNTDDSNNVTLFPDEVCHIWLWNPYDPIMGFAPVEAGEISITTDYKAAFFNANFFDEGGSASGILSAEKNLTDKQIKRMMDQIKQRHSGYKKANRMMLLEGGMKFSQTTLSQKDMEFLNLRRFNQERILQIFGMKKSIISVTDDLNYATAKEQKKDWWESTNIPLMTMVDSALTFCFLRGTGLSVKYNTSEVKALKEDFHEKVKTGAELSKMGYTSNEINKRLALGFEEKSWRDIWWGPMSTAPLSLEVTDPDQDDPDDDLDDDSTTTSPFKSKRRLLKIWKAFIKAVTPIENRFQKKVRSIFWMMRKKALAELFDEEKTPTSLQHLSFEEEMINLEKAAAPMYQHAVEVGVGTLAAELGIEIDVTLTDPVVVEYLNLKLFKIKDLGETVSKQLNLQLAAGTAAGESIDQIAGRVRAVFNAADSRAKTIARTEVVGSSNFGRYVGINRSGFKNKEWFTAQDEKVRVAHNELGGQVIPVNGIWENSIGSLRFPGDPLGAPANIINCRCIEVVVKET